MSNFITLPAIDFQHDALAVCDDVAQGVVEQEDIWISCYQEDKPSVHGKVKLTNTGQGLQGLSLEPRDGVELTRTSHTTFQVSAQALNISATPVRFPRQTLSLPSHTASQVPPGINSIDVSPHGTHVVYGGPDGYCYVQEVASTTSDGKTQDQKLELKGHVGDVLDVKWFPSGEVVLTASSDATIKVFSSVSGVNPRTLKGHKRAVTSIAILGVGKNVLSGSKDGSIRLWDIGSGTCISTMFNEGFVGVERITVGSGAKALRAHLQLQEQDSFQPTALEGEQVDVIEDKLIFAGLSSARGLMSVYDLASKQVIIPGISHIPPSLQSALPPQFRATATGPVYALAYDPQHHLLASGSRNGVIVVRDTRCLDVDGEQHLYVFASSQAGINDLAFVPAIPASEHHIDLVITPDSGLPYRAKIPLTTSDRVTLAEAYAGWEAVPVNSVSIGAGEGNVWLAGDDGGVRRY